MEQIRNDFFSTTLSQVRKRAKGSKSWMLVDEMVLVSGFVLRKTQALCAWMGFETASTSAVPFLF